MKVENLILELKQLSQEFQDSFGELNADQMNFKQNTEEWSIAQVVDHLIAVNKSYFPIFEDIKRGSLKLPLIARVGFVVRRLGNSILKSVEPSRKKKIKTFPVWEPTLSDFGPGVIDDFVRTQEDLSTWVTEMEPWMARNQVIYSPANRNIVYTLEKALEIIVTHEKRHLAQALEVKDLQAS